MDSPSRARRPRFRHGPAKSRFEYGPAESRFAHGVAEPACFHTTRVKPLSSIGQIVKLHWSNCYASVQVSVSLRDYSTHGEDKFLQAAR